MTEIPKILTAEETIEKRRADILQPPSKGINECCCREVTTTSAMCCDSTTGIFFVISQYGDLGILKADSQFFEIFGENIQGNFQEKRIACLGQGYFRAGRRLYWETELLNEDLGSVSYSTLTNSFTDNAAVVVGNHVVAPAPEGRSLYWKSSASRAVLQGSWVFNSYSPTNMIVSAPYDYVWTRTGTTGPYYLYYQGQLLAEYPVGTNIAGSMRASNYGTLDVSKTPGGVIRVTLPPTDGNRTMLIYDQEGTVMHEIQNPVQEVFLGIHTLEQTSGHSFVVPPPIAIAVQTEDETWYVFKDGKLWGTGNGEYVIANADVTQVAYWSVADVDENRHSLIIKDGEGMVKARWTVGKYTYDWLNRPTFVPVSAVAICGSLYLVRRVFDFYHTYILGEAADDEDSEVLAQNNSSIAIDNFICCGSTLYRYQNQSAGSGTGQTSWKITASGQMPLEWNEVACCGQLIIAGKGDYFKNEAAVIDPDTQEILASASNEGYPASFRTRIGVCNPACGIVAGAYGIWNTLEKESISPDVISIPSNWSIGFLSTCCADVLFYTRFGKFSQTQIESAAWVREQGELVFPPTTPSIPVPATGFNCCGTRLFFQVYNNTFPPVVNQSPYVELYVFDSIFGLMLFDTSTLERLDLEVME